MGRVELLSPGVRQTIESASAAGDVQRLTKFGRFLGPFITQMERSNPGSTAACRNANGIPDGGQRAPLRTVTPRLSSAR